MCTDCVTDICAVLDALILSYWRDHPPAQEKDGHRRPKYVPMDVTNAPKAAAQFDTLQELIKRAPGIGFKGFEFKKLLADRTGLGEHIEAWANQDKIPNGMARKMILSCAEEIVRERGAKPQYTMAKAA